MKVVKKNASLCLKSGYYCLNKQSILKANTM